ncbi:tripartite tricarboxylate transporter permease [Peptoniphilus catoniae]|uniref:tripartite tricarboxylate transporter permease n=1 Tax=Peptoniphilus catoniae TaxID=1660341 RepID=UPI0010FE9314|nr:tripartite tricarboxylate transporter permease [Peptoniphilus catoniae]
MDFLSYALTLFTFDNMLWLTIGSVVGSILGALPGMSATTGIAIFLPVTFGLPPVTGLITLAAIYVNASYGGNITAVLINTPGTDDSLFMTIDGYPMTVRGEGLKAIGVTTFSAFVGGMVGSIALLFIAPPLAQIAVKFGPVELFLTTMMGIVIIVGLSKENMLKGLASASLGLLCSVVGVDGVTGMSRLNFGIHPIFDSLPLLPVVLGLFAVSQVLIMVAEDQDTIAIDGSSMKGSPFLSMKDHLHILGTNIRSAIIGTIVGIIPAAGTTVAAGISYNIAKKTDKRPETFGKGNERGLAAVSAANNAVVGGSMVPLLTLGIPGNGTSALFLGGLLIHGLAPGVQLFERSADVAYGLIFGFMFANLFILLIGLFGAPLYARVTIIPKSILIPVVGCFCVLGAFTFRSLVFDIFLILFFGFIGYYMIRANFSMAPFVLAFVLGKTTEISLRRAMSLYGGAGMVQAFTKPIPLLLIAVNLIFLLSPFIDDFKKLIFKKKA